MDVQTIQGSGPSVPAVDDSAEGGIVINPHSAWGKELVKHEQHQTYYVGRGQRPGNPYVFREYPKMLYKAHPINGKYRCLEPPPDPANFETMDKYQRAVLNWETFQRSCQRTVKDSAEEAVAQGQGWAPSALAALELAEQTERAVENAAAEAAAAVRGMSAKAQAEYKAADESTHRHVADVVGSSHKKRGPKPKIKPVTGETDNG